MQILFQCSQWSRQAGSGQPVRREMGTWGHKCCSVSGLALPGPLGFPLSPCHTALSLSAFIFPLTNHSQILRRPIISLHHTCMGPSGSNALLSSITTCYNSWCYQFILYQTRLRIHLTLPIDCKHPKDRDYRLFTFTLFFFYSPTILLPSPLPGTHRFSTFTVCFWDCSSAQFSKSL